MNYFLPKLCSFYLICDLWVVYGMVSRQFVGDGIMHTYTTYLDDARIFGVDLRQ